MTDTNTLTLSRRIVAALVERGVDVPQEWATRRCPHCDCETERALSDVGGPPVDVCLCRGRGRDSCFVDSVIEYTSNVPDLAQPENLHLLLEVADSVGHTDLIADWNGRGHTCFIGITKDAHKGFATTRSLAVLAAVCAALGIDTAQETTHAAD